MRKANTLEDYRGTTESICDLSESIRISANSPPLALGAEITCGDGSSQRCRSQHIRYPQSCRTIERHKDLSTRPQSIMPETQSANPVPHSIGSRNVNPASGGIDIEMVTAFVVSKTGVGDILVWCHIEEL